MVTVKLSGSNEESNYREFEYEVPVVDGDIITVKAVDLVGHETVEDGETVSMTLNDDKGNGNKGNGSNSVITTIPKTGGTNSIYVIAAAFILVVGGSVIGFKRKKNN